MNRVLGKKARRSVRYSLEFKHQTVRKLRAGQTLAAVSAETGVSVPTLISWKKLIPPDGNNVSTPRVLLGDVASDVRSEIERLQHELAKVIEERDRLRKSIAMLIGA